MEIERKFLIHRQLWDAVIKPSPKKIVQAYLVSTAEKTIRIRIKGDKGFITIKGPTKGISRSEFEYEIPLIDAEALISQFAEKVINKERYEIYFDEKLWEIDVFHGKLEGLILAEIELESEDETFSVPEWIGKEVSHDVEYYNARLVEKC
jgi:CYTH domain-containing protein